MNALSTTSSPQTVISTPQSCQDDLYLQAGPLIVGGGGDVVEVKDAGAIVVADAPQQMVVTTPGIAYVPEDPPIVVEEREVPPPPVVSAVQVPEPGPNVLLEPGRRIVVRPPAQRTVKVIRPAGQEDNQEGGGGIPKGIDISAAMAGGRTLMESEPVTLPDGSTYRKRVTEIPSQRIVKVKRAMTDKEMEAHGINPTPCPNKLLENSEYYAEHQLRHNHAPIVSRVRSPYTGKTEVLSSHHKFKPSHHSSHSRRQSITTGLGHIPPSGSSQHGDNMSVTTVDEFTVDSRGHPLNHTYHAESYNGHPHHTAHQHHHRGSLAPDPAAHNHHTTTIHHSHHSHHSHHHRGSHSSHPDSVNLYSSTLPGTLLPKAPAHRASERPFAQGPPSRGSSIADFPQHK